MLSRSSVKTPKNQQGLALLILIIVIVLAFATYSLSGLSINQVKTDQKKQTRLALKQAKEALIAHAITHMDKSGDEGELAYFPCPDLNVNAYLAEGGSDGVCDSARENTLGYFPWVSLDTDILRDQSGSCLWYAVSGSYKNNPNAGMINEDTNGQLQIVDTFGNVLVGGMPEKHVVAIVFAPGGPVAGQTRTISGTAFCGEDYGNASEYLEGNGVADNGNLIGGDDVVDQFIHSTATSELEITPYNDQFVVLTRNEIWVPILSRTDFAEKMENLTQALAMCLASYANLSANTSRRIPWPVKADLNDADYRGNANYKDEDAATIGYSGRFPFDVSNSNSAISATLSTSEIFDMAGCNSLAVGSGAATTTANLLDPSDPGPPPIPPTEYRKLWNNWKDHFFYILSKAYEPGNTGAIECNLAPFTVSNPKNCIEVNGMKYAGAVIFSGKRLDGVVRDDKSVISDYLEDGKAEVFNTEAINKTGSESYDYTSPQTDVINDIMYCIETDMSVIEC